MVVMEDRMEYVVRAVMDGPIEQIRERVCRALNRDPSAVFVDRRNDGAIAIDIEEHDKAIIIEPEE